MVNKEYLNHLTHVRNIIWANTYLSAFNNCKALSYKEKADIAKTTADTMIGWVETPNHLDYFNQTQET